MVKYFGNRFKGSKRKPGTVPDINWRATWPIAIKLVGYFFVLMFHQQVHASTGLFYRNLLVVDAGPDVTICKGDTIQLTATGASSYQWSPAASLSCTNCPSPRAFPQSTTTYFVLANDGSMDSVKITVLDSPVFLPTNNIHPSDCGSSNGSIKINASGAAALDYSIDGGKSWSTSSTFSGLAEGDYRIAVRYRNTQCIVDYPFGVVVLQAESRFFIQGITIKQPGGCKTNDGTIVINTTASGSLLYSIDNGNTSQTGNTFSNLGPGTYQIKVVLPGSNCVETAVAQLVLQNGCPDTINVRIPPDRASQFCLSKSVFEMQGFISGASVCGSGDPLSVSAGSIDSTCLTLVPASGFIGTASKLICVIHCFNNNIASCDTTWLRVTVFDGSCPDIFTFDTLEVSFQGNPTPVCVPLSPTTASKYNFFLKGNSLGNLNGCNYDSVFIYSYAFITGAGISGPYELESWSVNGTNFKGAFSNIQALVNLMNVFDPAGQWKLDTGTGIIFSNNLKSTYGNMRVKHIPTSSSSVIQANLSILPAGFLINLSSAEQHTLIASEPLSACQDTLFINIPVIQPETGKVYLKTTVNKPTGSFCISGSELPGRVVASASLCKVPDNGLVSFNADTCLVYTPAPAFTGLDSFCVVACTNTLPRVCDTTLFHITISPQKDTMLLTIHPGTGELDTCLQSSILGLKGTVKSSTFCGIDGRAMSGSLQGKCLSLNAKDGFYGVTTACVVHCDSILCDTTILFITVPKPEGCQPGFQTLTLNTALKGDTSEVCLPVPFNVVASANVFVDGNPYNRALKACDEDRVLRYNWQSVAGNGVQGAYEVNWQANGGNFSATVANMQALLSHLRRWDPEGLWVIDTSAKTFITYNEQGQYGLLSIKQLSSGSLTNLSAALVDIAFGTTIVTKDAGLHKISFVNKQNGCRDTLWINAIAGAKVLDIVTVESVPSRAECIDTTGLKGRFTGIRKCELPQHGMVITKDNCFTYNPLGAFIGKDRACLTVCDDKGNCDTILLNIRVDPLCSLFDFFPTETLEYLVDSCFQTVNYCVPVRLDSLVRFAITDNNLPYTGSFTSCNGNQSQMKLDTGLHIIVFRHLTTGCNDTLKVNVRCKSQIVNCGVKLLGNNQILATDCISKTNVCFELPFAEKGKYRITDNGTLLTTGIVACNQATALTALTLDTGAHTLVFRDTTVGCSDTLKLSISCPTVINRVIDRNVTVGDSISVCLSNFGYDVSKIDSVVADCPLPVLPSSSLRFDWSTSCMLVKGFIPGRDTFCFRVYGKGFNGKVTLNINVQPPCPGWFQVDTIRNISNSCSGNFGQFCIPISTTEIKGKLISIDDKLFTGDLVPCKFDSLFVLNYNELPERGLAGPYMLERWTVNGILFKGEFSTAADLIALILSWDPTGKWELVPDPASMTTLIRGGNPQNSYGAMNITQKNSGIKTLLGINAVYLPVAVSVPLSPGKHKLKVQDPTGTCTDSVLVFMGCINTSTFRDSIAGGKSKTYCLDLTDLPGKVTSVTEVCGAVPAGIVDLQIKDNCISVTGLKQGTQTICAVACDDLGFCDTTKLTIAVTGNANILPLALDDTVKTTQDKGILISVIDNDKFVTLTSKSILQPPKNGNALMMPDGMVSYEPNKGYCDEKTPDIFTYVICSALGCDTATVRILVECKAFRIFNAFSPNGDGINDFFTINGLQNYPGSRLRIFNRWGNLVLDAVDYRNNWYGTWKEKDLPDGTYFYVLDLGDGSKPLKGPVYIRR